MHRQASFIPAFFPEGTVEVGEDADFFYFPAYEGKDLGSPVLGAGTLFAITKDSPGSHALMSSCKPRSRMRSGWRSRVGLPDAAQDGQHWRPIPMTPSARSARS
jgi:hypothetical protein